MMTLLEQNLVKANAKHANPSAKELPSLMEGFRTLAYQAVYDRRTRLASLNTLPTPEGQDPDSVLQLLARSLAVVLGSMQASVNPLGMPSDTTLDGQCFQLMLVVEQLVHELGDVPQPKEKAARAFGELAGRFGEAWQKNSPRLLDLLDGDLLVEAFNGEGEGNAQPTAMARWLKTWVERLVCHRAMCSSMPEGTRKARVAVTGFSLHDADLRAWVFYDDEKGNRRVQGFGGKGYLRDALAHACTSDTAHFPEAMRTVVYPTFVALGKLTHGKVTTIERKRLGRDALLSLRIGDEAVRASFVPDRFFDQEAGEQLAQLGEPYASCVEETCNLLGVNRMLLLGLLDYRNALDLLTFYREQRQGGSSLGADSLLNV